jgi:hypothetical protein
METRRSASGAAQQPRRSVVRDVLHDLRTCARVVAATRDVFSTIETVPVATPPPGRRLQGDPGFCRLEDERFK